MRWRAAASGFGVLVGSRVSIATAGTRRLNFNVELPTVPIEQPQNVRLGLTTALSVSRHQSIKLYGSTGSYNRTDNDFWAVGIAWQYRWGGGL